MAGKPVHYGIKPNLEPLNIVRTSQQQTLLNSDLFPFKVGQNHDSFELRSVKDVMLFSALSAGHSSAVHGVQTGSTLKQNWV
jgi:hypothetical protein